MVGSFRRDIATAAASKEAKVFARKALSEADPPAKDDVEANVEAEVRVEEGVVWRGKER